MSIFSEQPVEKNTGRKYEPQDGDAVAAPATYNAPRGMVASSQTLPLKAKSTKSEILRPSTRDWQRAAWDFYDEIGEIKFAFGIKGAIMSRVRLYPAVVIDPSEPPTPLRDLNDDFHEDGVDSDAITAALKASDDAFEKLSRNHLGGLSELMRSFSINLDVAGEFFFLELKGRYIIASIEELTANGSSASGGYRLKQSRDATGSNQAARQGLPVAKDTYVARIWRGHPRWSKEPDSTMLGVLSQCEKLSLLDRAIRATARSRMNAGLAFVPDGIHVESMEEEERPLEQTIFDALTAPVENEAAGTTVAPLILRGPPEVGDKIQLLDVLRTFDPALATTADRALERLMQGMDIPKDMVTGLANVRYSNAIVIDDGLYKAHIEPTCLFAVDSMTSAWYRPFLRRVGVHPKLVDKLVVWYDPSEIVTRPDRSTAANEGYDRGLLSGMAWRTARGFNEADAPDIDERILRIAFENAGQVPPDTLVALLEHFAPEIFEEIRNQNQQESGMPSGISSMLEGGQPPAAPEGEAAPPVPEAEQPPADQPPQGGPIPPQEPAQ